ncbi:CENP-A multicopy suppressor protein 2 [Escovopsis weberi]|uniref:CENP-A multicopy suppressor protein 2 n=1 Tax=Escovopsis weberi TaxID=150374 RepID=A0A0M8MUI3_ESCWE|nr:CENP-A multicopy suppressor protein 2 [Escovopsis weberi]
MYSNHSNNGINRGMAGMPTASEVDEYGVQTRTMGLKVHYTFDKEAKVQCLARCPQLLQIQTAAIDDKLTIGLVDLRTCIHVITEASPEITHQDCDYTIYAVDHSEPDLPLVGYGLLSWTIDSLLRGNPMGQPPKMVTGRVARNVLGVFGGGSRETLEVRLKLSEMAKPHRPVNHPAVEQTPSRPLPTPAPAPAPTETAMIPTGHSEWTSFLQSNPQIGQPVSQMAQQPAGRELLPRTTPPAQNVKQTDPAETTNRTAQGQAAEETHRGQYLGLRRRH